MDLEKGLDFGEVVFDVDNAKVDGIGYDTLGFPC